MTTQLVRSRAGRHPTPTKYPPLASPTPFIPTDAAGLADVPEGQLLEVEATLTALHPVTTPAPGVSKKTLSKAESSYMRPNEGASVRLTVGVTGLDGDVLEGSHEVEFVLDEEQVGKGWGVCVEEGRVGGWPRLVCEVPGERGGWQ